MQNRNKHPGDDSNLLPQRVELSANDVDEYADIHRHNWDLEYEQLSCGPFRATKVIKMAESGMIYREEHNQRVYGTGSLAKGKIIFAVINEKGRSGRFWGRSHPAYGVPIITPDRGPDLTLEKGYEGIIAVLDKAEFRERYGILSGSEPKFLDTSSSVAEISSDSFSRLSNQWQSIFEETDRDRSGDSLIDRVVTSLVEAIPSGGENAVLPSTRAALVRRSIELWETSRYTLSITQLALALRVSQRALNYSFHSHLGESPKTYFNHRQLHLARKRLKEADPKYDSVTRIATDIGVTELGRFSVRYREMFGESPSHTLKGPSRKYCPRG